MPGGKIQLEAYGDQNDYFNENPDISFFKLLYKRHTNFSIETIKQYKKKFNFGDLLIIKIGRDGDLLTNLFLEINLNLKYIDTSNQLTYNEYFIHLAAILGTAETITTYDIEDVVRTNILGTTKILKMAKKHNYKKVVVPTTPDVTWLNPYKITKGAVEKIAWSLLGKQITR